MDRLNHECLEHIFSFFNCGPREWLLLSRVCRQWQEVFLRFWTRITIIKIDNDKDRCNYQFNPNLPYLSTKMVSEMLDYAAEYVTELNVTQRTGISNITLGNPKGTLSYNLNGLNLEAFLESLSENSTGQILKANVLPDQPFLEYLTKDHRNLKELNLTLDKDCFEEVIKKRNKSLPTVSSEYNLRGRKINAKNAEEKKGQQPDEEESNSEDHVDPGVERVAHQIKCVILCIQIYSSFPELNLLTVTVLAVTDKILDFVEELLDTFPRTRSIELRFRTCDGVDNREVVPLLRKCCFADSLDVTTGNDFPYRQYGSKLNLDMTLTATLNHFVIKSITIQSIYRFGEFINDTDMYCRLFNKAVPSMQKLEFCSARVLFGGWEDLSLKYLLIHAVKVATHHNRKVVINELIEITKEQIQGHVCERVHDPIFPITVPLEQERVVLFRQRLEECLPTYKILLLSRE